MQQQGTRDVAVAPMSAGGAAGPAGGLTQAHGLAAQARAHLEAWIPADARDVEAQDDLLLLADCLLDGLACTLQEKRLRAAMAQRRGKR